MKTRRKQSNNQSGFILVLTLWVLVVVAIAAGYFADRVGRAIELAQQSRQSSQALIDMTSTRAEVLYRLSTSSLTEFGLGRGSTAIALDDRPYRGSGTTIVRIQDTRGLLNLNLIDDGRLNRFLGLMGIEAEQRGRMIDTLRDYTDADNLTRLSGAEDSDYRSLGLPPPSNLGLVTPWQARSIIGWRDAEKLWESDRFVSLTTTGQTMGINPNTAPMEVLATLPGVTEDVARAILTTRAIGPITHEGQLSALIGAPLNMPMGMGVVAIPADTLRITQSAPDTPWSLQTTIKLTPNSTTAPWRTDFYSKVRLSDKPQDSVTIADLPPRSIVPPDMLPWFLMPR